MRNRDTAKPFAKKTTEVNKDESDNFPPIFSFEKMRDNSGYSVNCCEQIDQASLLKRLFKLSSMRWSDIRQAPRHGLGTEIISRSSFNAAIPNTVPSDVNLLAIRYNGTKPFVGYRVGRIFYLVFVDHNFTAYKHG